MTIKDELTVERALGIVEGVASVVDADIGNILITAVEMIESAMRGEKHERD